MKCFVCGKTEEEIKDIIDNIILKLQNKFSANKTAIEHTSANKMIEEYSQKNGFTRENKESVRTINNNLKEMGVKAFLENYKTFINIDNKLEILYEYISNKNINHYNKQPQNINGLIELFCNEPDENKIKQINSEMNKIINDIETENKDIEISIEKLKKIDKYLFERSISLKHYEIPETQQIHYSDGYSYGSHYYDKVIDIEPIIQKCCPDEYKKATKIILCPFCKAMFADASHGALNYIRAQQEAMDDD
jgi:hypothetical protein